MYVAKFAGFSPYNYLGRLAASCIQPCDGMPDLGPSFNEQEVIQVLTVWLLFQSRLQLPPFEVGGFNCMNKFDALCEQRFCRFEA